MQKWRRDHGKSSKIRSKLHNYFAIKEYLQPLSDINTSIKDQGQIRRCALIDPIELIKDHPKESCSPARVQRAALEFFDRIMETFLRQLILIFEETNNGDETDYNDMVRTYRKKKR